MSKNAFIIKYCIDVNDISLYKGKIIKDFKDIYIIEEGGKIKEGKEDVKKEIHELNKGDDGESEDDLNYYIIKAPIESFDNNENVKEIKYQIELIDLPGIDISKNYDKIFREEMMQFPNGIIYLSIGTLEDKTNINLLETILKNKLFNSTFFVRTFAEKSDFSIDSYYSVLKKKIEEKCKNQNFIDIVKRNIKLEVNKNLISKFSNDSYKKYQDQLQQFKSFNFDFNNLEELYGHLKNDFIKIDEKEFNEFIPEEEKLKQIKQKLESNYNNEKNASQNIYKLYLFISNNTEKLTNY
jgi:hypothetical protein